MSMGIKDELTPDQWRAVYNAPYAAAVYVTASSGGYTEERFERHTANNAIKQTLKKGGSEYGELVVAVIADMNAMSGKEKKAAKFEFKHWGLDMVRPDSWMVVNEAAKALKGKPGIEGFKQWVLDIARVAAERSRGGLLSSTGNQPLDSKEIFALSEIERIFQ
jgi:hypothetical protein